LIETSIQDLTAHQSEPQKIFFLRRALKAFVLIAFVTFGICRGGRRGCRVGICSCRIVVSLAASLGLDFLFKLKFLFFDVFSVAVMTRKCSPRMNIGLLVIVMMAMAVIAVEDAKICKVPKGEEEMEGICNGIDVAMTEETLFVDGHRLQQQIDELSSFSDTPPPSVTRILFTENDVAARRYSWPQTS
jgi:hypothetical protein